MGIWRPLRVWSATTATVLLLAACGGDAGEGTGTASSTSTSASSPSSATVSGGPYDKVSDFCTGAADDGEVVELRSDDGQSVLPGVEIGDGTTAVVLLHQTTGMGGCGWIGYAGWLASQDVHVLAPDLCDYGRAVCSPDLTDDRTAQVALAVDHLREKGATRVVLVGASFGGSVVEQVAADLDVDAVVSLSPAEVFTGLEPADERMKGVTQPFFLATAEDDDVSWPNLEEAFKGVPAKKSRFVVVPGAGHGYSIVTDGMVTDSQPTALGKDVLDWVRGDYDKATTVPSVAK